MIPAGFRSHKTIANATEGKLSDSGEYLLVEVTNAGDSDTNFYPNVTLPNGQPNPAGSDPIPILAKSTRQIPMAVYNFKSDAVVTVVAYRS